MQMPLHRFAIDADAFASQLCHDPSGAVKRPLGELRIRSIVVQASYRFLFPHQQVVFADKSASLEQVEPSQRPPSLLHPSTGVQIS
jgi:hypothetical protein